MVNYQPGSKVVNYDGNIQSTLIYGFSWLLNAQFVKREPNLR